MNLTKSGMWLAAIGLAAPPAMTTTTSAQDVAPPTVAVLEISGETVPPEMRQSLTARLRSALDRTDRFRAMPPATVDPVLREHRIHADDCADVECAKRAGGYLGVGKIVVGRIEKSQDRYAGDLYAVVLRMVDVSTGAVETAHTMRRCEPELLLGSVIPYLAERLVGGNPPPPPETDAERNARVAAEVAPREYEVAMRRYRETLRNLPTERPPLDAERVFGEVALGTMGGAILALPGALVANSAFGLFERGDDGAFVMGVVLGAIGYVAGAAGGVAMAGDEGDKSGSFGAALFGSILGTAAAFPVLLTFESAMPAVLFAPIGATIGFNISRRYKAPPAPQPALLNFGDGRFAVASPAVSYRTSRADGNVMRSVDVVQVRF